MRISKENQKKIKHEAYQSFYNKHIKSFLENHSLDKGLKIGYFKEFKWSPKKLEIHFKFNKPSQKKAVSGSLEDIQFGDKIFFGRIFVNAPVNSKFHNIYRKEMLLNTATASPVLLFEIYLTKENIETKFIDVVEGISKGSTFEQYGRLPKKPISEEKLNFVVKSKDDYQSNFTFHDNIQKFCEFICDEKWNDVMKEEIQLATDKFIGIENINKDKKRQETKKLRVVKDEFISKFDTNKNRKLDIVEDDGFNTFLRTNQAKIMKIDPSYIQKLVKLSHFLRDKGDNLQQTFGLILKSKNKDDLNKIKKNFEIQIVAYSITMVKSFEMLLAVSKEDLITFFDLYEEFDSLGIFNSNWEKELTSTLSEIKEINKSTLKQMILLSDQMVKMEKSMMNGFSKLDKLDDSINRMNESLTKELKGINNKLWWNNVFQMAQIYQNRKTNKLLSIK